jgi:hypothetical protein
LDASKTKVADLEIAILVDENVTGLQVTVNDPGGVDVFETSLYMIGQSNLHRLEETSAGACIPKSDRGNIG